MRIYLLLSLLLASCCHEECFAEDPPHSFQECHERLMGCEVRQSSLEAITITMNQQLAGCEISKKQKACMKACSEYPFAGKYAACYKVCMEDK